MYKTVYTEVEVDVDLSDFETDDLIEELESRGELPTTVGPYDSNELVQQIWYITNQQGDIKLPYEPGLLEWLHENYPYSNYRIVESK